MGVSMQMLEVAIGWEVYTNSRSARNLGLIGLAEFIPMFALALPAGQLADRLPRRLVARLLAALERRGGRWLGGPQQLEYPQCGSSSGRPGTA
jgi:Transmembrane secretion effector